LWLARIYSRGRNAIDRVTIVAATRLEANAIRREAPKLRVVLCGIGLRKVRSGEFGDAVVSSGLAGGLRDDLPTGSVVIPQSVAVEGGVATSCDPELSAALIAAAQKLGYVPLRGSLLTSAAIISGEARSSWACAGFIAADMETGLIRAPRVAAVRVILDTPHNELSDAWRKPASALTRPYLWPQGLWLARNAPRCARIAAQIVAAAFSP
jgi:hypothetical protein